MDEVIRDIWQQLKEYLTIGGAAAVVMVGWVIYNWLGKKKAKETMKAGRDIIQGNTIEVKTLQVIHTQGESKEKPDAEPDAHVTPPCMPRSLGKIRLRGARRPRKNGIM